MCDVVCMCICHGIVDLSCVSIPALHTSNTQPIVYGDMAGEGGPGPEVEDALGRALKRAIESGDTDLVLHVLFSVYKQQPVQDFWAFLNTRALAKNLFVKYCKERVGCCIVQLCQKSSFKGR